MIVLCFFVFWVRVFCEPKQTKQRSFAGCRLGCSRRRCGRQGCASGVWLMVDDGCVGAQCGALIASLFFEKRLATVNLCLRNTRTHMITHSQTSILLLRSQILLRIADILERRADEFAVAEVLFFCFVFFDVYCLRVNSNNHVAPLRPFSHVIKANRFGWPSRWTWRARCKTFVSLQRLWYITKICARISTNAQCPTRFRNQLALQVIVIFVFFLFLLLL